MDSDVPPASSQSPAETWVVDICGRSSDLVLHGPAAGVLGCCSARGYLCGHWGHVKKKRVSNKVGWEPSKQPHSRLTLSSSLINEAWLRQ